MKCSLVLAATAVVMSSSILSLTDAARLFGHPHGTEAIPDSFIVILKSGHTPDSFQPKFDSITHRHGQNHKDRDSQGRGRGPRNSIHQRYQTIPGFAATLDRDTLQEILNTEEVDYVEQDAVMKISTTQASPPSWGLVRVSERNLNLSLPYGYNPQAGWTVTAYVVDTGVYAAHEDFGGRATLGANFVKGSPNTDEHGHGTHVSGTIAGTKYGVAKRARIVGVKVLGKDGSGTTSGVVAGMDWVATRASPGRSVVNMSLGGSKSKVIDDAAGRLYTKNIPLIVAAGNDPEVLACDASPAGAAHTFTVGATDKLDRIAQFSSAGTCTEMFAPGTGITSAWIGSTTATASISGTSMASPHVAGVAALYLSFKSVPTAQGLFDLLTSMATPNKVTGDLKGAPNRLVYNGGATGLGV